MTKTPSTNMKYYYLVERNWSGDSKLDAGDDPGRWLFFIDRTEVDGVWEKVRTAFREQQLPSNVKYVRCSTVRASGNRSHILNIHCCHSDQRDEIINTAEVVSKLLEYDDRIYYRKTGEQANFYTFQQLLLT